MKLIRAGLVCLLVLSALGETNTFAGRPIVLKFDDTYLKELPEDRRKVILAIADALNQKGMESEQDYQVALPSSKVEQLDGQVIRLSDLFQNPTDTDEPKSLARDEEGRKVPLSPEQLRSIREEAILKVPSKKYPGRYHVWKLSTLLQEGGQNIQVNFEKSASSALGHLIIEIPANLVSQDDNHWSVRKGLKNVAFGLRGIASSLIGLIEETPKYSADDILDLVQKKKREYVLSSLKAMTPPGVPGLDDRLFNEDLAKQLRPEISRIQEQHFWDWRNQERAVQTRILKELRIAFPEIDRGRLQTLLHERVALEEFQTLSQRLREDKKLNELAPGYGILLANQRTAVQVTSKFEKTLQERLAVKELEIRAQFKSSHPVLSRVEGWLEPRVKRQREEFYRSIRWEHLAQVPTELEQMGLKQEASIAREVMQFQQELEEQYKTALSDEKVAARTFEFSSRIWDSKNWIRKEDRDANGNLRKYYPDQYETSQVSTDQWLWRWRIVGRRTQSYFKTGLYQVIVSNLWNGPYGLKAMNPVQPAFCSSQKMNPSTGEIQDDPEAQCSTYGGNLKKIWNNYYDAREKFETTPDEGLLGKGFSRPFHLGYQWIKWGLSSLVVGVGQPLLTACNAVASCTVTATSVVWAPVSSVFMLGLSATLYDMDYPGTSERVGHTTHRYFPAVQYCLGDVACAGAGQAVAKTVQSVAYDAPASFVKGLYAYVRRAARTAYDSAVRGIVEKRMAVPGVDSFWATRIQGPGLASNYYFQVEPEVALLALQAVLEREELSVFWKGERDRIEKPLNDYYAFFAQIAKPIGTDPSQLQLTAELVDERKANLDQLERKVAPRREKLCSASRLEGIDRSRIKQTEEDLKKTLATSEAIVSSFYAERLVKNMNTQMRVDFWVKKGLEEGDFEGLTRYYYANAFDNDFLIPIQKSDDDFVIEVSQPGLRDLFAPLALH